MRHEFSPPSLPVFKKTLSSTILTCGCNGNSEGIIILWQNDSRVVAKTVSLGSFDTRRYFSPFTFR